MVTKTHGKAEDSKKTSAADVLIMDSPKHNTLDIKNIPLEAIKIAGKRDRAHDDAYRGSVKELAASIAQVGLRQAIIVKVIEGEGAFARYELVAGERRLDAAKLLGWVAIAADILPANEDVADVRAAENLQRQDLNDDQKALSIGDLVAREEAQIHDEAKGSKEEREDPTIQNVVRTQAVKTVAERLGWPVSRVRDYAFIAELPAKTRALGAAGRLSVSHLRVLAQVPDPKRCDELASRYAAGVDTAETPMQSLDDLKGDVADECNKLSAVLWDRSIPFAGGPACDKCPDNSANRTGLFDGYELQSDYGTGTVKTPTAGICLKLTCFRAKNAATKASIRGAGDRIAEKVRAASAKDKAATQANLVREATAKLKFITPTVFGSQVRDRIKARLAIAPAKKAASAKTSGESSGYSDNYNSPQKKAERALDDALYTWRRLLVERVDKALRGMHCERMLLDRIVLLEVMDKADKKPAAKAKAKSLINSAFDPASFDTVAKEPLGRQADDGFDSPYVWTNNEDLLLHLATTAGVKDVKPLPVLAEFLPKPAAAKLAKPAKAKKTKKAAA